MLKDSFIVDNGPNGIWVWIGRQASAKERVEAMRNAHGFIMKKNYPPHTHISRVVEGGEPTEFKALFVSWKEKDSVTSNNNNKMSGNFQQSLQPNRYFGKKVHQSNWVKFKFNLNT